MTVPDSTNRTPGNQPEPGVRLFLVMPFCATFLCFAGCQGDGDMPAPGGIPVAERPAPPVTEAPGAEGREIPIARGDQLELVVREDPSIGGNYEVREGGHIMLGRFGRVQVEGKTLAEAERQIKALLERDQLTRATVLIDRLNKRQTKRDPVADSEKILVYMTGNVKRPGQHVLALPDGRDLGIYEALLITGGPGRYADERKVHILRADSQNRRHRIPVDLEAIKEGRIPDVPIGNGDIVVVPERVFGF